MKAYRIVMGVVVLGGMVAVASASSVLYSGQLRVDDGTLLAFGTWDDSSDGQQATLDWSVAWDGGAGEYTYTYELFIPDVKRAGISHVSVETSDNFDQTPWALGSAFGIEGWEWGQQAPHFAANPGMPEAFTGLKVDILDQGGDVTTAKFWISTPRVPVIGDFYAKGGRGGNGRGRQNSGQANRLYNAGFVSPDVDPPFLGVPIGQSFGTLYPGHLLVPNHATPPQAAVPEPLTALAVVAAGGGLMGYLRRRRTA